MKKQILSITILATLPFGAWADNPVVSVGPAAVPSNGTAVVATANPPYQTLTPTNDDKQHIASTAYVKGAYNDAIAAVNKVDDSKQDQLYNGNTKITGIQDADEFAAVADDVVRMVMEGTTVPNATSNLHNYVGNVLPTSVGVVKGIAEVANTLNVYIGDAKQDKLYNDNGYELQSATVGYSEFLAATDDVIHDTQNAFIGDQAYTDQLVTANEVIDSIKVATNYIGDTIDSKRVEIYTTWDNDNAKKQVAFVNASNN